MNKKRKIMSMMCLLGMLMWVIFSTTGMADARVGGGSSSGSRGSRSMSAPQQSFSTPSPYSRPQTSPPPSSSFSPNSSRPGMQTTQPQPSSGGFMRGMAGGLAGGLIGGMVGNMLFGSSHGYAGGSPGVKGGGCSSIGLMDILLIGGIVYLGYRLLRRRQDGTQF